MVGMIKGQGPCQPHRNQKKKRGPHRRGNSPVELADPGVPGDSAEKVPKACYGASGKQVMSPKMIPIMIY